MAQHIRRELRHDDTESAADRLIQLQLAGQSLRIAARGSYRTAIADMMTTLQQAAENLRHLFFQRAIDTRVPSPSRDSMWKSLTRRRAPDNPMPRPCPEVQPSVIASLRSAIPGPSSTNVRRSPCRPFSSKTCMVMSPPSP